MMEQIAQRVNAILMGWATATQAANKDIQPEIPENICRTILLQTLIILGKS